MRKSSDQTKKLKKTSRSNRHISSEDAAARHITDRKRPEEALRRSEYYLAESQRLSHVGSWAVSISPRKLIFWSQEHYRIFGFDPEKGLAPLEEVLGRIHPSDRPMVDDAFESAIRQKKDYECDFRIVLPDASTKYCHTIGHPVVNEAGNVVEFIGTVIDITERKQAEDAMRAAGNASRELSGHLIRVQDTERRHLARQLHDCTAQNIVAAGMRLETLRTDVVDERTRRVLTESISLLDQCLREIRTLSYLLHPPILDDLGLRAALSWFVKGFSERSGIKVNLDLPSELKRMPQDVETTLFRVVQESLTNIHRHSGSRTAEIRLTHTRTDVTLEVTDAGSGMSGSVMKDYHEQRVIHGVGIAGMRQRAKQIGGRLDLLSGKKGVTVRVVLPLC